MVRTKIGVKVLRIAITGGIGSGKTAVTDYLQVRGFDVVDADIISRYLTALGGKALPFIRENFGDESFFDDGSLNRSFLKKLVFNDSQKKRLLEEGTTKLVIEEIEKKLQLNESIGIKVTFVAAPLLFEFNMQGSYDYTWLIVSDEVKRIQRICTRDNVDEELARKIMSSQLSDDTKIKLSDEIIKNDGSLQELHLSIDNLLQKYSLV